MAVKNVVADLTRGGKLTGNNYDIWHRKIQYLLNKQELLETLSSKMINLKMGIRPNIDVIWKPNSLGLKRIEAHALLY